MAGYLGLFVVAVAAAILFVPRLPWPGRVTQQTETAVVSPAAREAPTGAFAYDNGMMTGEKP